MIHGELEILCLSGALGDRGLLRIVPNQQPYYHAGINRPRRQPPGQWPGLAPGRERPGTAFLCRCWARERAWLALAVGTTVAVAGRSAPGGSGAAGAPSGLRSLFLLPCPENVYA